MYRFFISAFGDEIANDLDTQLRILIENNVEYIEFRGADGKGVANITLTEMQEMAKRISDKNIKVSCVSSPIGKIPIEDDFNQHFDLYKNIVEKAHILNTKYIRLFSFYVPEGDEDTYKDIVIERLSKFTDYAKSEDVIILHENEKGIYGNTPERCLNILKSINSKNLRAIFDPANFVQCNVETFPHAFSLLKDFIEYMHIKDALFKDGSVVPAGYGDGRVKNIIDELKKMNFNGFLSIEPHLNNNLPGGGPENFKKALSALLNIIKEGE
ncbi:sugar phosphate isomerase/epimerase family protein [Caldicellulosiruptoraceae bacterium PP1]